MKSVYLDYNATTPLKPQAREAMLAVLAEPANASAAHGYGRQAKKILEDSRKSIAEAVSAFANEVVFCSSGTEANAWALSLGRPLLVSAIEHSSVIKRAAGSEQVAVNSHGVVDLDDLARKLATAQTPPLVSIMLANNETGVIQPIAQAAKLCKQHGALIHVDAVQALSKIPVDMQLLGADMLTISAHKCGGPVGAAALIIRDGILLPPMFIGGGQEKGRRAGTENIAAIAGFAVAISSRTTYLEAKLRELERELAAQGAVIIADHAARLPNTSCIAMQGVSNEVQLMDFDLKGFSVSAGSACSSGRIEPSHVLLAMGVSHELAASAIRISTGWKTTEKELQDFGRVWLGLAHRLNEKQ